MLFYMESKDYKLMSMEMSKRGVLFPVAFAGNATGVQKIQCGILYFVIRIMAGNIFYDKQGKNPWI